MHDPGLSDRRGSSDIPKKLDSLPMEKRESLVKKIEELSDKITAQEEMINMLLDHLPVVIWMTDSNLRLIYASPAFDKLWGMSREEAYKNRNSWKRVVHPDDIARVEEDIDRVLRRGDYKLDHTYRIQKGKQYTKVRVKSFPVFNTHGKLYRIVGITRDIEDDP